MKPAFRRARLSVMAALIASLGLIGASLMTTPANAGQTPRSDRLAGAATIYGRSIELHIDYRQAQAWAVIGSGDPTDEVWLDRSYDGGETVTDERLGYTTIPDGSRTASTDLFALRGPKGKKAVVRACGKAGNRPEIVCSDWVGQQPPPSPKPAPRAAADALMDLYDEDSGLFLTTGWWNNGNSLTALIDYAIATGDHRYDWVIANTFEKNKDQHFGNFTNEYIDDTGWWALAWIRAYDHTGEERYLEMAKFDAAYMWSFRDDVCGGGLWWRDDKTYKNAVTNELFIKIAAELHQRTGEQTYLDQAVEVWEWFDNSGMINDENLINDGLVLETCESNGDTTWTYNQGIILGALTALADTTGDATYLDRARILADASTSSTDLNPAGVLTEPCEPDCGADGPTFKGVYVRNLAELAAATDSADYVSYLDRQAKESWKHGRNDFNQYGLSWAGPFTGVTAATHTSGFEAQTAPVRARR